MKVGAAKYCFLLSCDLVLITSFLLFSLLLLFFFKCRRHSMDGLHHEDTATDNSQDEGETKFPINRHKFGVNGGGNRANGADKSPSQAQLGGLSGIVLCVVFGSFCVLFVELRVSLQVYHLLLLANSSVSSPSFLSDYICYFYL